jgi:hypothetical protein
VPEFYLRRFAESDFVQLIDRTDPSKTFRTNVDNATVVGHFHTIETTMANARRTSSRYSSDDTSRAAQPGL